MAKKVKKAKRKRVFAPPDNLNAQQERFCEEYIIDYNGTAAASRAGYSEKSATVTASRLLRNAKVLARVRELQAEQAERLAMSADWVMLQLRACYQRCMQQEPVMAFDPDERRMVETGEWAFDSKGALKAMELMGKQIGMFENKVKLDTDGDFNITVNYGEPTPGDDPKT